MTSSRYVKSAWDTRKHTGFAISYEMQQDYFDTCFISKLLTSKLSASPSRDWNHRPISVQTPFAKKTQYFLAQMDNQATFSKTHPGLAG